MAKKRRPGLLKAWYDFQLAGNNQAATVDGITSIVHANEIIPQAAVGLQFGKKQYLKVLRLILKFLLMLTSTGAEGYVKILVGIRTVKTDMDGTLPPADTNQPNLQNTDGEARLVDWWYRDTIQAYVPATNGLEASGAGGGAPLTIPIDFKPNRDLPPGHSLVAHIHVLNLGTVTNSDSVATYDLAGRVLFGKRGGM